MKRQQIQHNGYCENLTVFSKISPVIFIAIAIEGEKHSLPDSKTLRGLGPTWRLRVSYQSSFSFQHVEER